MVPRPPRHKLLKSIRLRLGGAEFPHYHRVPHGACGVLSGSES